LVTIVIWTNIKSDIPIKQAENDFVSGCDNCAHLFSVRFAAAGALIYSNPVVCTWMTPKFDWPTGPVAFHIFKIGRTQQFLH
jgi:hypothetical protein